MGEPWWIPDPDFTSACCDTVSADELEFTEHTVIGRCGSCSEMSDFILTEEMDDRNKR